MKKILSFSVGLIFIGNFLFAQVTGDYQSISGGNWDNIAIWQRYNGTAFVAATDYPGQNTGTGAVTINIPHGVTLNVSPLNPIGSLTMAGGNGNNALGISNTFTLNVTGGVDFVAATTGSPTKSITVNGTLNAASLTMTAGTTNRIQILQINAGGTVTLTGNLTASATANIDFITMVSGSTLNIGGNLSGGTINNGTGTINIGGNVTTAPVVNAGWTGIVAFTGSGVQTTPGALTVPNVVMNNAASTLQLGGNLTVTGTLTLTNGKINTGTNSLILTNATPANQLVGGSSTSYVYSTGAGRLQRNGLAAATAYLFPIGTSANYLPVTVTPTTTSNFAVNAFTPASTNGVQGGPAFADASRIVNAVWNIDRPVGTGNSTITIQWEDALEGFSFSNYGNTDIGISRFSGSWLAAIATSANASGNTVTATFAAFGAFGVGLVGVVLPVKFGSIKAYEKQNGIQLDWKVYSENKVRSYEVERSADGRSYTSVGSLPALYNNTSDGDYGFFDANPLPGTSYYRIKNNDLDGKSAYSIVIRVNRNKTIHGLSLYPNPIVNGIVLLQGSDLGRGNYKINIFGANGQEIYKQQIKHNGGTISHTIELPSTISKGVYMLSVKDENGNIIFKDKLVNQ